MIVKGCVLSSYYQKHFYFTNVGLLLESRTKLISNIFSDTKEVHCYGLLMIHSNFGFFKKKKNSRRRKNQENIFFGDSTYTEKIVRKVRI